MRCAPTQQRSVLTIPDPLQSARQSNGTDESALMEAAAAGDQEALAELVSQALPDLRRVVQHRMGPSLRLQEGVSDIVQSVCREVLSHHQAFKHPDEGAVRRWLWRTAVRKIARRHRDAHTLKRSPGQLASLDEGPDPLARGVGVSREMEVKEELSLLRAAIDSLPDDQRQVVLLAKIEEIPREEIAQRIGRSPGATRMLLHRALTHLASVLSDD